MCGRFVQALELQDYADFFDVTVVKTEAHDASFNVAPTDQVYGVIEHAGGLSVITNPCLIDYTTIWS